LPREIDVLDTYLADAEVASRSKQQQPNGPMAVEMVEVDTQPGRSSKVFPGAKINHLEVLGREVRQGRYGPISRSKYRCRCLVVRPGGSLCGVLITYGYHQLYYGNVYSCGCTPRPKHPAIRLENRRFGRVMVMQWATEENAWELTCEECGAVLYRKGIKDVEQAGESCEGHAA